MADFFGVYSKEAMLAKSLQEQKEISNDLKFVFNGENSELNLLLQEAKNGNIACQDFLSEIYLNGFKNIVKNRYVGILWGLVASSNGSKLSFERIDDFLKPAFVYVIDAVDHTSLLDTYNLNKNTYVDFVYAKIASSFVRELNLDAKKICEIMKSPSQFKTDSVNKLEKFRDDLLDQFVADLCL